MAKRHAELNVAQEEILFLATLEPLSHRWNPFVGRGVFANDPDVWQGWPPKPPKRLSVVPLSKWTAKHWREYAARMAEEGKRMLDALMATEIELRRAKRKLSRRKPKSPGSARKTSSSAVPAGLMGTLRKKTGRPRGSSIEAIGIARKALLVQKLSKKRLSDRDAIGQVLKADHIKLPLSPTRGTIANVMTQQRKLVTKTKPT